MVRALSRFVLLRRLGGGSYRRSSERKGYSNRCCHCSEATGRSGPLTLQCKSALSDPVQKIAPSSYHNDKASER